ncbi:MAG: carbohydrate ABC transporter permease [bacterium]
MSVLSKSKLGPLARREQRLALGLLLPTVLIVFAIVLFPLLATFWISFKPVTLADLRPPEIFVRERTRGLKDIQAAGETFRLEYRLRNSSQTEWVRKVVLKDNLPKGLLIAELDNRCQLAGRALRCELGDWEPAQNENLRFETQITKDWLSEREDPSKTQPTITGESSNKLLSSNFTLENFSDVFVMREFEAILLVTFAYTVLGTLGAIVVGLFAAQLLNLSFPGRMIFRGLFLFPYVAPVIAMAFTWLVLLDPNSGALNALLLQMGAIETPINFFGIRWTEVELFGLNLPIPLALLMVIAFEVWRYFPLSFLFILARMQSVPQDMFEAAEMDGATPFQKFRELWLPQLAGILAVLFLLRFIWTFNKFDDIFLLTGGAAGTRTLTVSVYEQAFAINNLGAGCAVAVVISLLLGLFALAYFRSLPAEEGL